MGARQGSLDCSRQAADTDEVMETRIRDTWIRIAIGLLVAGMVVLSGYFSVLVSRSLGALGEIAAETEELVGIVAIRNAVQEGDAVAVEWALMGESEAGDAVAWRARLVEAHAQLDDGVAQMLAHASVSDSRIQDEESGIRSLQARSHEYLEMVDKLIALADAETSDEFYTAVVQTEAVRLRAALAEFVAEEVAHIGAVADDAEQTGRFMRRSTPLIGPAVLVLIALFSVLLLRQRRRAMSALVMRSQRDRALAKAGAALIESGAGDGLSAALGFLVEASGAVGCFVDRAGEDTEIREAVAEVGVIRSRAGAQPALRALLGEPELSVETVVEIPGPGGTVGWIGFTYPGDSPRPEEDWNLLRHAAAMIGAVWERESSYARLQEVLRSKDAFLASVSHELRTPMTAVLGLASELADSERSFSDAETRELCGIIAEQTTEVSEMLEDLLVAARTEVGTITIKQQRVALGETVAAVATSPSSRLRLDQRGTVSGQATTVVADGLRVRQILRNLTSNAKRYGGETVAIEFGSRGRMGFVRVVDDGPPLSSEDEERLFERFFTTDRTGTSPGGIGLGLPISLTLAQLMGGDLTFYRAAEGNVFELTLPVAADQGWSVG